MRGNVTFKNLSAGAIGISNKKITASAIVTVHINDAPAGIPIDELADTVRCLPLETGVIDLVGFMRKVAALGYGRARHYRTL